MKIIVSFLLVIIIIYGVNLHFKEKYIEKSYKCLIKGNKQEATMLIKEYNKALKSDTSASTIMINLFSSENLIEKRIEMKEYLLQSFPFSPKVHYLLGSYNIEDYRYYDAFIDFSIANQLYPAKKLYYDSYVKSLELIGLLSQKHNN